MARRSAGQTRNYTRFMEPEEQETAALLARLRTKPRGASWGSIAAEAAFTGSASGMPDPNGEGLFSSNGYAQALAEAEADVNAWRAAGLRWVTVLDDAYPQRLRDIREMPPFLFYEGDLKANDLGMSVVGSRSASEWGKHFAADAARLLAEFGLSVLSGLAEGIDAAAHRAALDSGGRTVAFLGTGITKRYPASNSDLQAEIAQRGLVLSQFYPHLGPTKQSFPMRNATMSGYGLATIVVEATEFSGARIQARLAGEHGRPVILTSRVVRGTQWGNEMAKKPNVRVVDSLSELNEAVTELRDFPQRLEQVLSAVTGR